MSGCTDLPLGVFRTSKGSAVVTEALWIEEYYKVASALSADGKT